MAWENTLLDASFRGVKFDIEGVSDSAQRDLQRHAYPYVAGEDIEDLGRAALAMSVRAVLWGNDYENRLQTLLAALEEPGPGELIHPIFGSIERAVVGTWRVEHSADQRDGCTVQIEFSQDRPAAPFFVQQLPEQKAASATSLSATASLSGIESFANRIKELTSVRGILGRLNAMRSTMSRTLSIVRNLAGLGGSSGILDLLEYPGAFASDLQSGLRGLVDLRSFSSNSLMPDWKGLSGIFKDVIRLPAALKEGTLPTSFKAAGAGTSSSATDNAEPAIAVHADDLPVIESVVNVIVATELADVAADVLVREATTPTLSPPDIEVIVNDVREMIQIAVDSVRDLYPVEEARPITEPLKSTALAIQEAAIAVIDTRPPLIKRTVDAPANLHLLAHRWYGDYARASELARLNPRLRNPNDIKPGDVLNAYQR